MRSASKNVAAQRILRPVLLVVFCGVTLPISLWADEPFRAPASTVKLSSGRVVDYTIHFDRNALEDSARVEDGLIALTSSGTLLRFTLPEVRLDREQLDIEDIACLGWGEKGAVLAGLSDGRICRVDPATLALTDIAKVPDEPRWIGCAPAAGNRPAGLVAVTSATKPVERKGRRYDVPVSVVHDLGAGKTFTLDEKGTKFLLDGEARLWLGADRGEWGGRITRVDLRRGTVASIKPPPSRNPDVPPYWEGVYGFISLRDGQVWAFGGTSHMGINSGYVTRVDGVEPRPLFRFQRSLWEEGPPDPNRPEMPITSILEEKDGLLVFSYSDVFRVDRALKSWKRAATLEIKYHWGRPDAVGAYPSVQAVHPPRREGEPYVIATLADGYVLLDATKTVARGLPGQLGASGAYLVQNTEEGTIAFDKNDRLPVWILRAQGWDSSSLSPPFEVDPANDTAEAELEKNDEDWDKTRVLVGPGGSIYTVSGTDVIEGTRTTAHRVGGKSTVLGRETSALDPSSSFITADGTLWNASFAGLKRFENGRWKRVAALRNGDNPSDMIAVNRDGPPWLLFDGHENALWQLVHGANRDNPQLTRFEIKEGETSLAVHAAIPWSAGTLLLATDAGLRTFTPAARRLAMAELPAPSQPMHALVRDGLGRLWLGGERGLWIIEADGKALESLDRVPWAGRGEVESLAPDPRFEDGVIAALGPRGVAFLRAGRKP